MNKYLKTAIKTLCMNSGVLRATCEVATKRILILGYHSIQDIPSKSSLGIGNGNIHSPDVFCEQMQLISEYYNPVTLDDLEMYLKGIYELPRRAIIVTFDDGFIDNYNIALPIMDKYNIKAAFFLTVGAIENRISPWYYVLRKMFYETKKENWKENYCDKSWSLIHDVDKRKAFLHASSTCAKMTEGRQLDYLKTIEKALDIRASFSDEIMMTWDHAKDVISRGHIIGSHTISHPNLAYINKQELYAEMFQSKKIIENNLCNSVNHFSYPHPIMDPHCNKQTISVSEEIGYRTALTTIPGYVRKGDNPLKLCRMVHQNIKVGLISCGK